MLLGQADEGVVQISQNLIIAAQLGELLLMFLRKNITSRCMAMFEVFPADLEYFLISK